MEPEDDNSKPFRDVRHYMEALKEDKIQIQSLWLLGQLRDERAVPALIELLTDTSPTSRREAAITLG